MQIISGSVGKDGTNVLGDVVIVQKILGLRRLMFSEPIPEPDEGGMCGHKTIAAIAGFQAQIVRLPRPDGRIDLRGRTLQTLVQGFTPEELQDLILAGRWLGSTAKRDPRMSNLELDYAQRARRTLSIYTEDVIRTAMALVGIARVGISSTLRTIEDQARIMYDNCRGYPNADDVKELRAMRGWGYSAPGRAVEEVYFSVRGQPEAAAKQAMQAKILEFAQKGVRVSLHCVPGEVYAARNIVDIPYGSVPAQKKARFQDALIGMSAKVTNAVANPHAQEIIGLLIVEDKCWHLEVPQFRAPLPQVIATS